LKSYLVQFERPVSFFGISPNGLVKKEIDISVFSRNRQEKVAIELKAPSNGQHPEQMFQVCRDIRFLEQLSQHGFDSGFSLLLVEDRLFYDGVDRSGIYSHFRENQPICGSIRKPTGKKDETISLSGSYSIGWKSAARRKYSCVRVRSSQSKAVAAQ